MRRRPPATSARSILILGCAADRRDSSVGDRGHDHRRCRPPGTLPVLLTHRIAYDLPADLNPALRALIGSLEVSAPVLAVNRRTPTVIAAPLQGPGWFNAVGCCLASALHRRLLYPANGTWVKGETFAIDWLQERDGRLFEGDGSRNSQWFGFGAPLLAVADGTVVGVVDGKPDIAPGAPPILATPRTSPATM